MKEKQDVLKLHLLKEKGKGLGIQLTKNTDTKKKGIFISHLLEDSVAEHDGRLQIGDEILFINGQSLLTLGHKEAVQLLHSASNPVQLVISRKLVSEKRQSSRKPSKSDVSPELFENNNNIFIGDVESPRLYTPTSEHHTKEIILINGRDGKKLGFSMAGGAEYGSPLVVKNILAGGIASLDGRLRIGDHLLKVNDIPLDNFKYNEAVSLFKSLKQGQIKLLVKTIRTRRSSNSSNDSTPRDLIDGANIDVVIKKVPGKGLGVGFGQSSRSGIFIKYLAKGSLAARKSLLQLKDQVVALNGIGTRDTSLDDFHKIIHNIQPGDVRLSVIRHHRDSSGRGSMTPETSRSRSETGSSVSSGVSTVGSGNDLAGLMSPAVPLNKQKQVYKRERLRSAILLNESDDDDDYEDEAMIALYQKRLKAKAEKAESAKTKDGWLMKHDVINSDEDGGYHGNEEDAVMNIEMKQHSPNQKTMGNKKPSKEEGVYPGVDADGLLKVIIERDKTGSLGLSIKMKKNNKTQGAHEGVYAKNVAVGGSADRGGVKSGDQIIQVNKTKMEDLTYGGVIAFFKKIPKKTTFVLRRPSSEDTRLSTPSSTPQKKTNSTSSLSVPNLIDDDDMNAQSQNTPILRNSILESSFRHSRTPSFRRTNSQQQGGVTRASTFKIIGKIGGIGVPLPESSDVPEGYNVHLLEVSLTKGENLGLSLVPATSKLKSYLQIRQIQLTSPCVDLLLRNDAIFSVNGISFKHINHAQALQILKQCEHLVKLVILREKDTTAETKNDHVTPPRHIEKKVRLKSPKTNDALPGTIVNELKSHLIRPTLHRRTTENSSLVSIPQLTGNGHKSSPVLNQRKASVKKNLAVPNRSDEDSSSLSSNPNTPSSLPKCYAVNERTNVGAFMVKKEKTYKVLGLDVMMDELGLCHVTEISKHGMFANDNRIRVGDNLLAINKESLSGKPISFVRNAIRSVSRGDVEIILRAAPDEDEESGDSSSTNRNADELESVITTATTARFDDFHDPTELPLPADTRSKVPTQRQTSFNASKNGIPAPSTFQSDQESSSDDDAYSDVTCLPPAPPKPIAPHLIGDDNDSDNESCFSAMPAPPPPVTNFKPKNGSPSSRRSTRKRIQPDFDDAKSFRSDFDDGKSDFYIPPPPPPVLKSALGEGYASDNSDEDSQSDKEREKLGHKKSPVVEEENLAYKRRLSIEIAQKFVNQNIEGDENLAISRNDEEPTEIYYPRSYHQQKDKKKSLFSRLKSKLLLPSKNDLNSPDLNNTKMRKKDKQQRQRPVSAADFRDTSSRRQLKASISQPDLMVAVQNADVTDSGNGMRKFDSLDGQSFSNEVNTMSSKASLSTPDLSMKQSSSSSSLSVKQLPRILSFRKQKPENGQKKKKRRNSRPNVSPPRSPAPVPPSPTLDAKDSPTINIEPNFEPFSPYDIIPSPSSDHCDGKPVESPYEVIDKFRFSGNQSNTLSETSSASQSRYAADGPSTLKEECSFENALQDSRLGNHLGHLDEKPPPPPPRPPSLQSSPLLRRNLEIGIIETDTDERPGLKKRGSSLLSLNFPPPPGINYDDEKSSPIATSSVENSLDFSDEGLRTPEMSQERKRTLSLRDKADPKLQPFQVPNSYQGHLSPGNGVRGRPVSPRDIHGNYSNEDDDISDWGSEFSNSVVNFETNNKGTSRYASEHRANLFEVSTKVRSHSKEPPTNVTNPKTKNLDRKKLFSINSNKQRSTSSNGTDVEMRPPTTNKEKRDPYPMATSEQKITEGEIPRSKSNPIPKPPRRGATHHIPNEKKPDPSYENIQTYQHQDQPKVERSSSIIGRPVPPIPIEDTEEFRMNNTSLTDDELNQLYASVDLVKKKADRLKSSGSSNSEESGGRFTVHTTLDENGQVKEGVFKVKLVRESGKTLGFVITGGRDTPIEKVLIKQVEDQSLASTCSIPLKAGDELLEVNGQDVTEFTHFEVLNTLQDSPPLVKLTIFRSSNGNQSLLQQQSTDTHIVKDIASKLDSQSILASFKGTGQHSKESEIISINKRRLSNSTKPQLTVDSFDSLMDGEDKINRITKTPPLLPKSLQNTPNKKNAKNTPTRPRGRTSSVSSTNINVSVTSPMKATTPLKMTTPPKTNDGLEWLEIDLYKQPGRGLGIAVTGGPKHIVKDGIRVKRLIPDSIASLDNRLRKDDLICTINGRQLKGMTQGDALNFLKDIPKVINLGVKRGSVPSNDVLLSPASVRPKSAPHSDKGDTVRRSRPQTKEPPQRRSRSETRNVETPKETPKKRPSSVSRLSRLFRGSSESINSLGKEDKQEKQSSKSRKRSSSKRKNEPALLTIIFDKTDKNAFDFTLAGGANTIYGDQPVLVESVRRGSELSKSLRINDELISIQGIDVRRFPVNKTVELLSRLPLGRVCVVVQRKP
eukprot:TCONS_00001945-protein